MSQYRDQSIPNVVRWNDEVDFAQVQRLLSEDGYVLVRGLLPLVEILRLREVVGTHLANGGARFQLGKTQPNAAAHLPELDSTFRHPAVVSLFRGILGSGTTVFTRHCDVHKNMVSGWHKDSGETVRGGYFTGDYFGDDTCQVFKIAIYLQDSTPTSGLTVRHGSHRSADMTFGNVVQIPSRVGDAVVFDVRLTHTGQLPDPAERFMKVLSMALRRGRREGEDPRFVTRLHEMYGRLAGRDDRMSVFFTFGRDNVFTHQFAAANLDRQARQLGEFTGITPRAITALAEGLSREGILTFGVNAGTGSAMQHGS